MNRTALGLIVLIGLLAATLAMPAQVAAAPATWWGTPWCSQWHTVGWGENLFRISLRYGTTVGHLQALNGIANPNYIQYGQTICVRGSGWETPHYGFWYTVRWGDTLYGIGRRYGVSVSAILAHNYIPYPNLIYVGQKIWIP